MLMIALISINHVVKCNYDWIDLHKHTLFLSLCVHCSRINRDTCIIASSLQIEVCGSNPDKIRRYTERFFLFARSLSFFSAFVFLIFSDYTHVFRIKSEAPKYYRIKCNRVFECLRIDMCARRVTNWVNNMTTMFNFHRCQTTGA